MNIVTPGNSHTLNVIIRNSDVSDILYYIVEFAFPGGKLRYGHITYLYQKDEDSPAEFVVTHIVTASRLALKEKDLCDVSIYTSSVRYDRSDLITALTTLENSPVGDSNLSLKSAMASLTNPTIELVYRGEVFCTAETILHPYNPIAGDYETIEKPATTYKERT